MSPAEPGQRRRAAGDAIVRSYFEIVRVLSQGSDEREAAQAAGNAGQWTARIVRRYNERGLEGLGDRRSGIVGPQAAAGRG
jgi:hypothetical protein